MRLVLIAAMASNRVIGADNRLPWHLPPDLRRFKQLTMGHTLLMGRKTFASIGRALPGRLTVVVSRDPAFAAPPGVLAASSLPAALALASQSAQGGDVFVAGGAEIYRQTLPQASRLHLTRIERAFAGDACFPEIPTEEWTLREDGAPETGPPPEELPYRFQIYERITPAAQPMG
jgi:dihydrofolate reductase